jgi:hypothetical protein
MMLRRCNWAAPSGVVCLQTLYSYPFGAYKPPKAAFIDIHVISDFMQPFGRSHYYPSQSELKTRWSLGDMQETFATSILQVPAVSSSNTGSRKFLYASS